MCRLVHLRDCYSDSHISHKNMGVCTHMDCKEERKMRRLQEPAVSNGHESSMIRIVGIQDRRPGGSVVKVSRPLSPRIINVSSRQGNVFNLCLEYDFHVKPIKCVNMFNVWICQSSNFKAVGSPASNLHNLDLEADLQRQPVIFQKKIF